jgi:histidine triad (HIT) family protein
MDSCIFCRIVRGEIPSRKLFEDEELLAFHDIQPQSPVHFLVIPKAHIGSLYDCGAAQEAVLGRLLAKVAPLARAAGLDEGFRLIVNTGRIGRQEVPHLHVHVLGGPNPLGAMVPRSQH